MYVCMYMHTHTHTHIKQYTVSFSMPNTLGPYAGARCMVRPEIQRNDPHRDSESDYIIQYGASFLIRNVCPLPVQVHMHARIDVCMHACMYEQMYVCSMVSDTLPVSSRCTYVCMCVCMYVCMCVRTCVCTSVCIYIHVCLHTYMYVYIHT